MLSLSSRTRYAILAVMTLAKAKPGTLLQSRTIAETYNLSQNYLEQLLSVLKKSGIVHSVRGSQGGYRLARPASMLSIREIIEALDGPLLSDTMGDDEISFFWQEMTEKMIQWLDVSMDELIRKYTKKQVLSYVI